jgi:hypothetical protein
MTLINWIIHWFADRSNCVFYAVGRYRREGGYLLFERSPIPGAMVRASWSPDFRTWFSYVEEGGMRFKRWQVMIRQIWFKGYVREYRR